MLDLGVDLDLDVKKVHFPIHFEKKNICIHCGAVGTLVFVDKWGKESKREINAFDHIKCSACGRPYSILWQPDESNGKMYPSAVDPSVSREFSNLINSSKIKNRGSKEFD